MAKRTTPAKPKAKPTQIPLWRGPEKDGITPSMLSKFLVCRERFRLRVVHGLVPAPLFSDAREFGHLWHACESGGKDNWEAELEKTAATLNKKYPMDRQRILHWVIWARTMYPPYLDFWGKSQYTRGSKLVAPEEKFIVDYKLPSNRMVALRGRWDGIYVTTAAKNGSVPTFLQENKTKGRVIEQQLLHQLTFDMQTMFYLFALRLGGFVVRGKRVLSGVRYNVVRRPGHKDLKKLQADLAKRPEHFFKRWTVTVSEMDYMVFEERFLRPILEGLYDWWEWVSDNLEDPWRHQGNHGMHYRTPYGFYHSLAEGGSTAYDEYLATNSMSGLVRTKTLYPELEED